MNLRFSNQSIRFRISNEELKTLLSGEKVSGKTTFSSNNAFEYSIIPNSEISKIGINFSDWSILVCVPMKKIKSLAESVPSKTGLYEEIKISSSGTLSLSIEVDVKSKKNLFF